MSLAIQPDLFAVLDLFSGFGAYSLGLERTGGFRTVAFCEILPYPRRILNKHWPDVPIYEDVRELTGERLRTAGIVPDFIVAGWPCQGNSPAGTGLGMDDPRSELWSEIRRLAGEIRPRGMLLENSSNLLSINDGADFGTVLGDLASLRFNVEWHCLPAAAYDAPHIRDRVWIIATAADDARDAEPGQSEESRAERQRARPTDQSVDLPNTHDHYWRCRAGRQNGPQTDYDFGERLLANLDRLAPIGTAIARQERVSWQSIADFRGVVSRNAEGLDGFAVTTEKVANRVERIHGLGNLNPPIIPECIGRAILSSQGLVALDIEGK